MNFGLRIDSVRKDNVPSVTRKVAQISVLIEVNKILLSIYYPVPNIMIINGTWVRVDVISDKELHSNWDTNVGRAYDTGIP